MGYTYLKSIQKKDQSRLLENLQKLLNDSDCMSLEAWSESMITSGHFHSISDTNDEHSLYYLNKNDELISITFPAILDLNGKYSRIHPYFSFEQQQNVSSLLIIFVKIVLI